MDKPTTVHAIIQAGFDSDRIVGIYSSEELARKAKGAFALIIASGPFCKDISRIIDSFRVEQFSLDEVSAAWVDSQKESKKLAQDLATK